MKGNDRLIKWAAYATSGDEDRPAINRIWVQFDDEGNATLYATDSYRAVRARLDENPFHVDGDNTPYSWVPPRKGRVTWDMFVENARQTPASTVTMPKMDYLFEATKESPYREWVIDRNRHVVYGKPISKWSYFNGYRRKPDGIIKLMAHGPKHACITYVRGIRTINSKVGATFSAWEQEHFDLILDSAERAAGDKEHMIGDVIGGDKLTDVTLGAYSAEYLAPIEEVRVMRHASHLKPLYLATTGGIEHLVMPIRL